MIKKDEDKKNFTKGSVTVEAAFIVPLSLLVILTVISLCFYVHNRAWYTAAAAEAALSAGTEAVRKNNNVKTVLGDKIASFEGHCGYPDYCPGMEGSSSDLIIEVTADADQPLMMGTSILSMRVKEKIKVIRPVRFIRKIQALEIVTEE